MTASRTAQGTEVVAESSSAAAGIVRHVEPAGSSFAAAAERIALAAADCSFRQSALFAETHAAK